MLKSSSRLGRGQADAPARSLPARVLADNHPLSDLQRRVRDRPEVTCVHNAAIVDVHVSGRPQPLQLIPPEAVPRPEFDGAVRSEQVSQIIQPLEDVSLPAEEVACVRDPCGEDLLRQGLDRPDDGGECVDIDPVEHSLLTQRRCRIRRYRAERVEFGGLGGQGICRDVGRAERPAKRTEAMVAEDGVTELARRAGAFADQGLFVDARERFRIERLRPVLDAK